MNSENQVSLKIFGTSYNFWDGTLNGGNKSEGFPKYTNASSNKIIVENKKPGINETDEIYINLNSSSNDEKVIIQFGITEY